MPPSNSYYRDNLWVWPGQIIRFAGIFTTASQHGRAQEHGSLIRRHVELQTLYNPMLPRAQALSQRWAHVAFGWNIAVFVISIFIPVPFSLYLAAVDAVVVGYLSQIAAWQADYIPSDVALCKDAHDWQRPSDRNESFFEFMGRVNSTVATGEKFCKNFVQEQYYCIVNASLLGIVAAFHLLLCVWITFRLSGVLRKENKSVFRFFSDAFFLVPRFIFIVSVGIFYVIPMAFFGCLPLDTKANIRHVRRYITKYFERTPTPYDIKLKIVRGKQKDVRKSHYTGEDPGTPNELSQFLGIYDMLMSVAEHIHYSDIQSLALVSKSVYNSIYPPDSSRNVRDSHFRKYTCIHPLQDEDGRENTKILCFSCESQICRGCNKVRSLKESYYHFHRARCVPFCDDCYKKTALRENRPAAVKPLHCQCGPPSDSFNIVEVLLNGWDWRDKKKSSILDWEARYICMRCSELSDVELVRRSDARLRADLRENRIIHYVYCKGGCNKVLGDGPQWWVDRVCKKECTASCHSAWGKQEGIADSPATHDIYV